MSDPVRSFLRIVQGLFAAALLFQGMEYLQNPRYITTDMPTLFRLDPDKMPNRDVPLAAQVPQLRILPPAVEEPGPAPTNPPPAPAVEPAAPTNVAPTNVAPTNVAPTNVAPTNVAPTNVAPTNLAPTNAAPTNAAPTDAAPTDAAPTDAAPTDAAPTDAAPTDAAPTDAPPDAGTNDAAIAVDPVGVIPGGRADSPNLALARKIIPWGFVGLGLLVLVLPLPAFTWVLRLSLAALFIYAGLLKIKNPPTFAQNIACYMQAPSAWINPVAFILPWVEVLAGIALLIPYLRHAGAFLVLAMLCMFLYSTGIALWEDLNISCGCGIEPKPLEWSKLAKNTVYALGCVGLLLYRPDAHDD